MTDALDRWADGVAGRHPTATAVTVERTPGEETFRWEVVIWPAARVVHASDSELVANDRRDRVAARIASSRLFATRPFGTCPRCADPLVSERRCANCGEVVPAGARVSPREAAASEERTAEIREIISRTRS